MVDEQDWRSSTSGGPPSSLVSAPERLLGLSYMPADSIVNHLLDIPPAWRDRTPFTSLAGSLSFEDLRQSMLGFSAWLAQAAGIRPGDRIALCLPKSLEAVQAIFGILATGAAYVPAAIRWSAGAACGHPRFRQAASSPDDGRHVRAPDCGNGGELASDADPRGIRRWPWPGRAVGVDGKSDCEDRPRRTRRRGVHIRLHRRTEGRHDRPSRRRHPCDPA